MRILKPINETFNNEIQAQEDNINDAINDLAYIQFKDPFIEQICHENLHVYTYADAKKITKIDGTIFNNAITDFESFDELRYFTNLKEIGNATFISCGEFLQQISLPNSITKIGHQAFQYTLLEEITIPNKITKLEFNTFYECRRLKKVILPKNLKIIENAVFSYCVSLQEIHIPDTVTEIGDLAFYDCESLQEINIPDNIKDIGSRAFGRCENLKTIYVSRKNYEKFKNWSFGKLLKIKNNSNLVNETFNNEIQAQEDNIDDAIQELNFISYKDDEYLKFFKNVQEIINKQLVKKYLLNKKQVRFKLFGDNLQRILRIDFYTHSINTISDTMIADSYELTYQLRLDNIIKDTFSVHEYYPNINEDINEVYLYSQDLSKYKGVSINKLIYKNINGIYYYMNNVNAEKVAEYFIDKIKDIMNLTETFNNEIQAQEHNNIDSTIFEIGNKYLVDFIKNNQKYLLGMFLDYDDYYYVNTEYPKRCLEIQNKDLKHISRGLEYLKPFENSSKEDTLNTQWLRGMLFRGLYKACSSIDDLDILDIHITRHNIKNIELEEIKKYLDYSPDSPKKIEYFLDNENTPIPYSILQEKLKTLKLWFLACKYIINLRKEYDEKIKTIHNKLNSQYQNHIINGDVVSKYLTETFNNEIQAQTIDLNNIIKELNKNQYLQKYGLQIWQGIDYRCDNVYKGYQAIEEYIKDTEESIKSEIQYAIKFNHDPKSIKNKNILASIYNHGINYFYKGGDLDLNYEDSCNVWKLTKYLVRLYKDLQNELDNIKNNYVHNIQNGLIDDMKAFKEVFNTSNILDETFNNEIQAQENNIDDAIDGVTYIQFEDPEVERICHEKLHVYTYADAKKITNIPRRCFYSSKIESFDELKYFTNLHKIGVKAFAGCKTLQEITLPNNVTEIQFMAFAWCSSLQQINIPNNLNIIGDNTFEACSNLKNINIPSTVTKIGRAAFIYCQSLQNINIPNGITEILRSTFKGCKSLQNIIIPKKVTFIDSKAFADCKALQQINIPDGVTNIEAWLGENGDIIYDAFENCSNLKTIYVSKLNYERLRNCSEKLLLRLEKAGLEIEPKLQWINLLQIKDNLLTETFNNEIQAKKDNIEDTLNNKLSFVVSRDKFIEILEKDLHNFTKIDENTRFKNDTDWIGKYIEGGLSRSMNFYLGKFINQDESDTTIMETSTPSIFLQFLQENPKNANDNDPYLYAQVGLSVSFQPIAAMGISKLLNSTSIKSIYQQVFKYSNETIIGKTKVFKLTIGTAEDIANLINTINTDNFRREYMKMLPSKPGDLKKLFINYYKKYVSLNETFNNEIQAQEDNVNNAIEAINYIQFEDPEVERICHEKLHVYTYEDAKKITIIPRGIFSFNNKIQKFNELKYFTNLQKIREQAFFRCEFLQEITLPNSVSEIDEYAFAYCALQEIIIPNSITEMTFACFYSCKSLKKVILSNNIKKISSKLFQYCNSLQKIIIPNNITEIEDFAFSGCTSLQQINLPNDVTKIGDEAFFYTRLKQIIIPKNIIKISNNAFNGTDINIYAYKETYNKFKKEKSELIYKFNWSIID